MSRSIPINRFSTHDCVGISNATLKLVPCFSFIVSCLNDQMSYSVVLDRINSLCTLYVFNEFPPIFVLLIPNLTDW